MLQLLAKSDPKETIEEHTQNAINIWKELRKIYKITIIENNFWEISFYSVLFHDFGKTSKNFQDIINKNTKSRDNYIRHEFISGMFFLYTDKEILNQNEKFLSLLAIFSHHKPLDNIMFQNDAYKELIINAVDINYIINSFKKISNKHGYNFLFDESLSDYFQSKVSLDKLNKYFENNIIRKMTSLKIEDRRKYILYKAILNISDWVSSGDKQLKKGLEYNASFLKEKIINKLITEGKERFISNFSFKKFQTESIIENNIIAIAPTGSGKTEASLLWASNKKENDRIIYLLPTRVTSNAIYKRLTGYFGEEYTAVIHSSAYLFMKDIDGLYTKTEWLKDRTFFKNINVCTVDQILTQGFNIGYWEIKTFNMINARVIIDEIHLYQPYTLGLIISTIKYLKNEFGVKFYIMSATMPKKLKVLLSTALDEKYHFVQDTELLEKSRNEFQFRDTNINDLENEILEQIKKNKKILIVVNTVNEAIRVYEKYKVKTENVTCYHSRFIQKDRIQKEADILELEKQDIPMVLIATQVVEVSLDIDFDILFTENAPIDAIIQRAGRVNRKREKADSKVIIFRHTEITEKFVYENLEILNNTFQIFKENNSKRLTEKMLIDFVDEVYKNYDIEKDNSFIEGLNKYNEIQEKYSYIKDNNGDDKVFTREGLDTINIIPNKFEEEISELKIEEKTKYEISIRKNYKLKIRKDKDGFNILDNCEYDNEKGLTLTDKEINCLCM
jgi:CRISPR-associated endonuclease/helicase Cas3